MNRRTLLGSLAALFGASRLKASAKAQVPSFNIASMSGSKIKQGSLVARLVPGPVTELTIYQHANHWANTERWTCIQWTAKPPKPLNGFSGCNLYARFGSGEIVDLGTAAYLGKGPFMGVAFLKARPGVVRLYAVSFRPECHGVPFFDSPHVDLHL